jgi:predicted Rossmann fold nucleotide-binding protein DprA/Smf involved in DNA uptake
MEEICPTPESTIRHPLELTLNERERNLLNLIGHDAVSADELVLRSSCETPQVLAALSALEMRRLVRRLPGNIYARR